MAMWEAPHLRPCSCQLITHSLAGKSSTGQPTGEGIIQFEGIAMGTYVAYGFFKGLWPIWVFPKNGGYPKMDGL